MVDSSGSENMYGDRGWKYIKTPNVLYGVDPNIQFTTEMEVFRSLMFMNTAVMADKRYMTDAVRSLTRILRANGYPVKV